jgi:hypothetical protein
MHLKTVDKMSKMSCSASIRGENHFGNTLENEMLICMSNTPL